MLTTLVFVVSLSLSSPYLAQEEAATVGQAKQLLKQKSYAEAVKIFQSIFAKRDLGRSEYYDAACAAALAGQHEQAFMWLDKAIEKNWWNINHLTTDTDLKSLHDRPEWSIMLNKLQTTLTGQLC